MSTWRPAREDELIFDYGSYDGNGVITLGGIEAPSMAEVFLETEALNARVTVLSYEELDVVSGIEQGSMYQAARLAVFDMTSDPVIYNMVFGYASGNLAAGQLPPVMEWHDSENQVEASAYGTYFEINPTLYSGDLIAPVGWVIRLLVEFDGGDDGGGGGECFWTDLTRVVQVCNGEAPGDGVVVDLTQVPWGIDSGNGVFFISADDTDYYTPRFGMYLNEALAESNSIRVAAVAPIDPSHADGLVPGGQVPASLLGELVTFNIDPEPDGNTMRWFNRSWNDPEALAKGQWYFVQFDYSQPASGDASGQPLYGVLFMGAGW